LRDQFLDPAPSDSTDKFGRSRKTISKPSNIYAQRALVISYNGDGTYVCITTDNRKFSRCFLNSPVWNPKESAGVDAVLKPNTWVSGIEGYGGEFFIFGCLKGLDKDGNEYNKGEHRPRPGDVFITGKAGNAVNVYNNGTVRIQSTNTCFTTWSPAGSTRITYTLRDELSTAGMKFTSGLKNPDNRLSFETLTQNEYRDIADALHPFPAVITSIGSVSSGIVYKTIIQSSTTGLEVGNITIKPTGNISLTTLENLELDIKQKLDIKAITGNMEFSGDYSNTSANVTISGNTTVNISAPQTVIEGVSSVALKGAQYTLGNAAVEPIVLGTKLSLLLADMVTLMTAHDSALGSLGTALVTSIGLKMPTILSVSGRAT